MCMASQRKRGLFITPAKWREARGGEKHIQSKGKSQRQSLRKSKDMEQISQSGLQMERWDQEWVGWEETVKGHDCPDKEFGLYPLGFWGPSEIFHPREAYDPFLVPFTVISLHWWSSDLPRNRADMTWSLFLSRNITGHFTLWAGLPCATDFDKT